MNKNAKILLAGMAAGLIAGMLYAPGKGKDVRRKLKKLKDKISGADSEEDKKSLEELSDMLQKELDKINRKLEKL